MKVYKDILVELEGCYEEILAKKVNEEELPKAFLVESGEIAKGEEAPLSLKWHNAALLCKFVDEYERGNGVSPFVLEFLHNVIVDVLGGEPFDAALPIPREPRPDDELEVLAKEQDPAKKYEIGRAISVARRNGDFKSITAACEVIGPLWSVTPETAEQYYKAWQSKIGGGLSSNRRGKADT